MPKRTRTDDPRRSNSSEASPPLLFVVWLLGLFALGPTEADATSPSADLTFTDPTVEEMAPQPAAMPPVPPPAKVSPAAPIELSPQQIFEMTRGGIVLIETVDVAGGSFSGSGFLIDDLGHVATNSHVIANACAIQVTLGAEAASGVGVVMNDPIQDFAILRVQGLKGTALSLGSKAEIVPGARVVAIGYPLSDFVGRTPTISDGIYSGLSEFGQGRSMLRVSAPISPGSSGGPLFDLHARVIGITTSSLSSVYLRAQNVNFAVPIDLIRSIDRTGEAKPPSALCRDVVGKVPPRERAHDPKDDRTALETFKTIAAAIALSVRNAALVKESDRAPLWSGGEQRQSSEAGSPGAENVPSQGPLHTYDFWLHWYDSASEYTYNVYGVDPHLSVVTTFMGYVEIPLKVHRQRVVVRPPRAGECDGLFYTECLTAGGSLIKEKPIRYYEAKTVWLLSYQEGQWAITRVLGPDESSSFLRFVTKADRESIYRSVMGTK